jgi:hypothetical protein
MCVVVGRLVWQMNEGILQKRSERTKRKTLKFTESDSDDEESAVSSHLSSDKQLPTERKVGKKRGRKPGAGGQVHHKHNSVPFIPKHRLIIK